MESNSTAPVFERTTNVKAMTQNAAPHKPIPSYYTNVRPIYSHIPVRTNRLNLSTLKLFICHCCSSKHGLWNVLTAASWNNINRCHRHNSMCHSLQFSIQHSTTIFYLEIHLHNQWHMSLICSLSLKCVCGNSLVTPVHLMGSGYHHVDLRACELWMQRAKVLRFSVVQRM